MFEILNIRIEDWGRRRTSFTSLLTRYDYNLTIMKSPKPATDNRFKWTLCIV